VKLPRAENASSGALGARFTTSFSVPAA